jgi:hypothetical protein
MMDVLRSLTLLFCSLALLACLGCTTQKFRVVDETTGEPIEGAKAEVGVDSTLPVGVGHPASITLGKWNRVSDARGEFSVSSPWARDAYADVRKDGYSIVPSRVTTHAAEPDVRVVYLTPLPDAIMPRLEELLALSSMWMKEGWNERTQAPPTWQQYGYLLTALNNYAQAKAIAKTAKHRDFLQNFCEFVPDVRSLGPDQWDGAPDRALANGLLTHCGDSKGSR